MLIYFIDLVEYDCFYFVEIDKDYIWMFVKGCEIYIVVVSGCYVVN